MKKYSIVALIGIIIIVALIIIAGKKSEAPQYVAAPLVQDDNALIVADQKPDADGIKVSYAKLSKPGYIVVSTKDPHTNTSTVVGTSDLLPAGQYFNVYVKHTRRSSGSKAPQPVVVTLVEDNGDGVFTPGEDMPLPINEDSTEVADTEVLIGEEFPDVEDITVGDIAELLEEEGYTVNEDSEVLNDADQDEPFDDTIDEVVSEEEIESTPVSPEEEEPTAPSETDSE